MIFFGWGTKRRDIPINPRMQLIVLRTFFHLFFGLTVAWDRKFVLAQLGENGWGTLSITEAQAAQLNGGVVPDIHWWWRFSLLGFFGLVTAISVLGSLF